MPGSDFSANWSFQQCNGWNIEGAIYTFCWVRNECMNERLFLDSTLRIDLSGQPNSYLFLATSSHLGQNPESFYVFAFTWMSQLFSKTILDVLWKNCNSRDSREKRENPYAVSEGRLGAQARERSHDHSGRQFPCPLACIGCMCFGAIWGQYFIPSWFFILTCPSALREFRNWGISP